MKTSTKTQKIIKITAIVALAISFLALIFSTVTLIVFDNLKSSPCGKSYCSVNTNALTHIGISDRDMLVVKEIEDFSTLKIGDVIVFEPVVKSGVNKVRAKAGTITQIYHTSGDVKLFYSVDTDQNYVSSNKIFGAYTVGGQKVGYVVSGYGDFAEFVSSIGGYTVFVLLPSAVIGVLIAFYVIFYVREKRQLKNSNEQQENSETEEISK